MTMIEPEFELRIRQIRYEAAGVISLSLDSPNGCDLPEWTPGAHLEFDLPSGRVRQYSLFGDYADRSVYSVAVLREPESRGGSVEIHDTMRVGMHVKARGPRNHFPLVDADDYIFIAGGIGITPILSMVRAVSQGSKRWRLHYGGRSRASMAFLDVLSQWSDNVVTVPQDDEGLLDIRRIFAEMSDSALLYCCGPTPLLEAVQRQAEADGVAERLRIERFTGSEDALAEIEAAKNGEGFEVELARTNRTVRVEPGVTVLDALREVIPDLPSSCEEGFCGTCETGVLAGVPEHHDEILTEGEREEGKCMFICVSRSKTPKLVLDL